MEKKICTPLTDNKVKDLKSGDYVYITGTIYTATLMLIASFKALTFLQYMKYL